MRSSHSRASHQLFSGCSGLCTGFTGARLRKPTSPFARNPLRSPPKTSCTYPQTLKMNKSAQLFSCSALYPSGDPHQNNPMLYAYDAGTLLQHTTPQNLFGYRKNMVSIWIQEYGFEYGFIRGLNMQYTQSCGIWRCLVVWARASDCSYLFHVFSICIPYFFYMYSIFFICIPMFSTFIPYLFQNLPTFWKP